MPYHFRFGEADSLRIRFALSPLWETHSAVRVLARPRQQGYHLPWLRRIREAAAGLDLGPLQLLMPLHGHSPDFLYPPPVGPAAAFAEEIAAVRETDPALARDDFVRALADTPGAAATPEGRRMLADPAGAVQRLADVLQETWEALIAPEWPRLRAVLEADVAYHSRRLAEGGLERLFGELLPGVAWSSQSATLTVAYRGEHVRALDGQGLVLMPSVFTWPDVVSGFDPPWQPTVVYPARGIGGLWTEAGDRTPEALARLLGRARADVLCALDEPAGTTALAHRLGLAPSSVSAHLSVLREAGLLTSRRYGHQVLYERTPIGIALTGSARE
ncbi:winged helix-turn-helix domain-containing protein [Streptomyces sp. Je 1-79]|uniref:ArsR/SmtB family transcription factor n=1 Tax=Streptomyces sp. Je 1-79 TaxID=2943847 RepID=UPI0021A7057A|nr:winged helix-turn-helix domain-containing protein [Streptomyces sp. Je 1-79]MCT4354353.1 winged helix-turn-helix domain-containing protein [Streptomyces sp. Je 1-79]